jgi:hypothetical protein
VYVLPPGTQIGPITPEQRKSLIAGSLVAGTYERAVDRESAYEKLKGRAAASGNAPAPTGGATGRMPAGTGGLGSSLGTPATAGTGGGLGD